MTAMQVETDGVRRSRWPMQHLLVIQSLVDEVQRPFDEIAGVYQCELLRLERDAAVKEFLPVLVMKRVRDLYRHRLHALHDHAS